MSYIPQPPNLYKGKQAIINSDRILFNAKQDSILLFSNKSIGFSTNGSIHFDTSDTKEGDGASKFVLNSPNIYLGLTYDGNLPSEPAVLGDELDEFLVDFLDLIDDILDDIENKVSFISGPPGSPTAPNPANAFLLSTRRIQIKSLKEDIQYIKSQNTKLV
tara:strand:+ start:327 stop:809 length:483 start_codon:yes stop_codon:yes gene_type:complete